MIDALVPELDPATHIGQRCYHLRTTSGDVGLVFTAEEVEELRSLLAGAVAMDELDVLLHETLGSPPSSAAP